MLIDFSKYSSVKIGSVCDVSIITECLASDKYLIGNASNLLIDNASNLAILDDKFDYIIQKSDILEVGAKTQAYKLFNYCKKNDLKGLEFLSALPGQMGGICKMNAGMKEYEISNYILEVNIDGKWVEPEFSYRNSNIKGHIFAIKLQLEKGFSKENLELFKSMRENQPKGASFGSIFKNPKNASAGALIDSVGLKGMIKGGAMISNQHANFLINFNKASFNDAIYLINTAKEKVHKIHNILLEEEVIILK